MIDDIRNIFESFHKIIIYIISIIYNVSKPYSIYVYQKFKMKFYSNQ